MADKLTEKLAPAAAAALGEPVLYVFPAIVAGTLRGLASLETAAYMAGNLVGAGDAAAYAVGFAEDRVERRKERAEKEVAPQRYEYKGSKAIRLGFRQTLYVAVSASRVGIFRRSMYQMKLSLGKPIVVIPRTAIRKVEPNRSIGSFIWSFAAWLAFARVWTVTLEDGGRFKLWIVRFGKVPKRVAELFPTSDAGT
jgi:hypothetical protein